MLSLTSEFQSQESEFGCEDMVAEDPMDGWVALLGSGHGYQELPPEGIVLYLDAKGEAAVIASERSMTFDLRPSQFSETEFVRKFFMTLLIGIRRDSYFQSSDA